MTGALQGLYRIESILSGWIYVRVRDEYGDEFDLTEAQYRCQEHKPPFDTLPERLSLMEYETA